MKVIKLTAENFKRLKAVEIVPDGNMVEITGANEQGKSSVIDALWAAVGGATMTKATGTVKPIRDGSENAKVTVDLGDLIVTRKWNAAGSTLTVENNDGAVFKGPQAVLDSLIGKLAFDPLAFANMEDAKQRELLLSMVDLGIDLKAIASKREELFNERTSVNRQVKQLQANVATAEPFPASTPDAEIPISTVLEKIKEAQKIIRENAQWRDKLKMVILARDNVARKIAALEHELAGYRADLATEQERITVLSGEVEALVDPDLEVLNAEAQNAQVINENVRRRHHKEHFETQLKDAIEVSEAITKRIEDLDMMKDEAVRSAKYPIDGLGFSDTGVTFKGIPFSQCSSAERLRTSVAIAMAMNPKLRVIRITDGSLIDSKNMAIIEEMVKANDFQCWIERVDESGTVGVFIEDGEVKPIAKDEVK